MSEPEIQPAVASVRCSGEVVRLLLRRHRIPDLGLGPVPPFIVLLHGRVEDKAVERANADEPACATTIWEGLNLAWRSVTKEGWDLQFGASSLR